MTTPGRMVAILIALTGSFMMAIIVAIVTGQMAMDPNNKIALHHSQLTRSAVKTIVSSFKYF